MFRRGAGCETRLGTRREEIQSSPRRPSIDPGPGPGPGGEVRMIPYRVGGPGGPCKTEPGRRGGRRCGGGRSPFPYTITGGACGRDEAEDTHLPVAVQVEEGHVARQRAGSRVHVVGVLGRRPRPSPRGPCKMCALSQEGVSIGLVVWLQCPSPSAHGLPQAQQFRPSGLPTRRLVSHNHPTSFNTYAIGQSSRQSSFYV